VKSLVVLSATFLLDPQRLRLVPRGSLSSGLVYAELHAVIPLHG